MNDKIINCIYESARLEGLYVTPEHVNAICNDGDVSVINSYSVTVIRNLKRAWEFLYETTDYQ